VRWTKQRLSRKRSHLSKAAYGSAASVVAIGFCLFPVLSELAVRPSPDLLQSIAQIGGGLLIAWAIQCAIAVRTSHYRDSNQEAIVGAMVGSAACGLVGIIVALSLSERAAAEHWIWADRLAFSFAASALLFVGVCVVSLVYFAYEWSRIGRIDPPE
jgi:hypothetical protein